MIKIPLPTPKKGEKQKDFHSRCMGNSVMNTEYPKIARRNAICYSQWERSKKNKSELEPKKGRFVEFIKGLWRHK